MFSSLVIALAGLANLHGAAAQVAAWHMDTLNLLTIERLDPVVSPNQVSSHMHHIVGGSAFGASYNYQEQVQSSCTSASITADKSNYWMPKLYWMDNNSTFVPLPLKARFYYFLGRNSVAEPVSPFPEGLRMLLGDPNSKSPNPNFSFTCHINADLFTGSIYSNNFNFGRDCPYGIRMEGNFPVCWNGQDLYKSDNSHVIYPADPASSRQGPCPWTHPIRLPQIMLEYTYMPSTWAPGQTVSGHLVWANGDTTGYGIHADFINGWDTNVLATALNDTQCAGGSSAMTIQACNKLSAYYDSNPQCKPQKGQMNEPGDLNQDLVPISHLPGCNPPWSSGPKPGCSSAPPSPDVSAWRGTDGSLVASGSQNKARVLPTKPGWANIGCLKDSATVLSGTTNWYPDTSLSVSTCTAACSKSGFNYATVANKNGRWICTCGQGVADKAQVYPGMCTTACPGNSSEICGGTDIHSLYYAPAGTTVPSTAAGGADPSYLGCFSNAGSTPLSTKVSYSYTDNSLTTAKCLQACADHNATWAATTNARTCACGNVYDTGSGFFTSDETCNFQCGGNSTEMCGYASGYSLYNVSASSYEKASHNFPASRKGCYNDPGQAGLTGFSWTNAAMTPDQCQYGCAELGYSLAGLLFGNRCRCGNTWQGDIIYPNDQCSVPCTGNSSLTCGGNYKTELFETAAIAPTVKADIAARPTGWIGCYGNSNAALFQEYFVYDGSATVERCIATCKTYSYKWAGLANTAYCRCSNIDPTTVSAAVRYPSKQYCNTACPGNAKETCGAPGQFTDAYNMTAYLGASGGGNSMPNGYVGCYQGNTGLTGTKFTANDMTIETCTMGCKELGYSLAGLSGTTCYCGNSWTTGGLQPDYKCTTPCGGNSTQICGGSYITSLYNSSVGAEVPAVLQPGYLGCYADTGSNRALKGYSYSSPAMTNSICKTTCANKGYTLAATQGGTQCWCDNAITGGVGYTASSMCTSPCGGAAAAKCGGPSYQLSMFNATTPTAVVTASASASPTGSTGTTSLGCFTDYGTLNNNVYTSGYMTVDQCVSYCKGLSFTYAGLSGGNQCRCGNTQPAALAGKSQCSTPCVSNSKQLCGGTNLVDVWATSQSGSFIDAYSAAAADSTGSLGCWQDSSSRLLQGSTFTTSVMTPASCAANCLAQGYKFSGTEAKNQCFCSNTLRAGLVRYADSVCNYNCAGDANQKCGGYWAINVKLSQTPAPSSGASSSVSASVTASVSASKSVSASASASASPSPSAATMEGYKGCYGLGTFVSGATSKFTGQSQMSIGLCRRYCRAAGFSAAALNNGNSCYCGTMGTLGDKVADAGCSLSCAGDNSNKCGGVYTASVFDTIGDGARFLAGYPTNYVGCFTDSSTRVLNGYSFTSSSMTSDACRRTCAAKSFGVYGTQNGNQCFCGPAIPSTMTVDSQCTVGCTGNSTEKCGGSYRLSLYSADFANSAGDPSAGVTPSSSASASASPSRSASSSAAASSSKSAAPSPSSSSKSAAPSPSASSSKASSAAASPSASSSKPSSAAASPSASSSKASSAAASPSSSKASSVSSTSSTIGGVLVPSASPSPSSSAAPSPSKSSSAAASSSTSSSSAAASPSKSSSASPSPTSSTSTSSAAPPSSTNALGCFTQSTPILNKSVITCDTLTPGMCKLWCNSNNYQYAGMTNGTTCGCANDVSAMTSVSSSQCTKSCFSDTTSKCGGDPGTYNVWKSSALVARRSHRRGMRMVHGSKRADETPMVFKNEAEILEYIKRHGRA